MYMAPIVRTKPPVSAMRRRLSGGVAAPLAMLFMLPWLVLCALYAGVMLITRGRTRRPQTLR